MDRKIEGKLVHEEELDSLWSLNPRHRDADYSYDSDTYSLDEVIECPLCQQRREGCLVQYPYAVCWRCWTLASWRCWWQLKDRLPELAAEYVHRFLFAEWSVLDLTYQASERIIVDLHMLEYFRRHDVYVQEELVPAFESLMRIRPVSFVSMWPSCHLYCLQKKFPGLRQHSASIRWEWGGLDSRMPSLINVLGLQGAAELQTEVKRCIASVAVSFNIEARCLRGKTCIVGTVCYATSGQFPHPLQLLLRNVVSKINSRSDQDERSTNCLHLDFHRGALFRIGTFPLTTMLSSDSDKLCFVTDTNSHVKVAEENFFGCISSFDCIQRLKSRFPL
jgi:hypothetical protein